LPGLKADEFKEPAHLNPGETHEAAWQEFVR
jgi:hypothetical protein